MTNLLWICMLPALLSAQVYVEAIGQTQAFTLTAGAKAGWNPAITVIKAGCPQPASPTMTIYPNPSQGGMVFKVQGGQGRALVNIYDIAGKKMRSLDLSREASAAVSSGLPNGVYFARLMMNDRLVQSTRFLAVR